MKLIWSCFCMLACALLSAADSSTPITVLLSTESELAPLYLHLENHSKAFDHSYAASLEKVLHFDLNCNGYSQVTAKSKAREHLAEQAGFDKALDSLEWKKLNVLYLVSCQLIDREIKVRLCDFAGNHECKLEHLQLSGDLSSDRRLLHKLSNQIQKRLFHTKGIAETRILFTIKQNKNSIEKPVSEVWEADYDGGNPVQLTQGHTLAVTPAYIPGTFGKRPTQFLYVSYEKGEPRIFLHSLQKSGSPVAFSSIQGNQFMPAVSLQRTLLAFVCDHQGNPDLYLQQLDLDQGRAKRPKRIFSAQRSTFGSPAFSPDGKKLAFVSNQDNAVRIYTVDLSNGTLPKNEDSIRLLTKRNKENTAPCWSPDGKKLTYSARNGDTRQIWIYDFETGTEQALTSGAHNKENPSFAPDSLHIVYNSSDGKRAELYLINLNDPEPVQIRLPAGEKHFPCWEPFF